ncbi:MAG: extracellular solute-binding protein [Oscillospiraceae bacterium]
MKKVFATILALSLSLSIFAGCAGKPASSQAPAAPSTSAPNSASAVSKAPVELTLWYPSSALTDLELSLQENFMKQNPHITINNVIKEGDPGNDFYTAVAAGNAPDMVPCSFTMMDKYMKSGILEPLNKYFDAWKDKDAYDKTYVDAFTSDGKLLGLAGWSGGFYLGYNKALFKEAGIEKAPATWEEALADAKLITNKEKQQFGYATLSAEWTEWFFQYYVWQAGGDLTREKEDGTLELTFTDPAVIKAGEYYQQLRNEGVLQPDLTLKFGDLKEKFTQGKIGMMPFAGDWIPGCIAAGMKQEDIGLALFPAGPSGKSVTTDLGQCYVINAKTSQEKKDAAWAYIEFLLSVDTLTKRGEDMVATGAVAPMIYPRTDFDLVAVTGMPKEYGDVIEASKGGRLEFAGKATVGAYVDRAVQTILSDPNADVKKEFAKAQETAQTEVVDDYNAEILKAK